MSQPFPLFLSLEGRQALVVGGNDKAVRKIELLLAVGARVFLVAGTVNGETAQLIADHRITWAGGRFDAVMLEKMSLVIVAADEEALQQRVSRAAEARGLPVNVVDRPALSSFIMPSVVDRGPVRVAISTGGAAPALARKVRAEIERALPAALGRVARFAEMFREQVRRTLPEPHARRRFWDTVFDGRVAALALAGEETVARRELIRLLDDTRGEDAPIGIVHFVGAAHGDPDLLTLAAHRLLQHAHVVAYDRLASPAVLALARRDAERLRLDHRAPAGGADDAGIQRLAVEARAGKKVVRLGGTGVPAFTRNNEEVVALLEVGIVVDVVPAVEGFRYTNREQYMAGPRARHEAVCRVNLSL
jgi:uroporphyrin-III C-methyltransferase/precorrin-2 dehydrogenase/sirohydrochlorin ferrochelatase